MNYCNYTPDLDFLSWVPLVKSSKSLSAKNATGQQVQDQRQRKTQGPWCVDVAPLPGAIPTRRAWPRPPPGAPVLAAVRCVLAHAHGERGPRECGYFTFSAVWTRTTCRQLCFARFSGLHCACVLKCEPTDTGLDNCSYIQYILVAQLQYLFRIVIAIQVSWFVIAIQVSWHPLLRA